MVCNLTIGKAQYRDFEEELKSVLTKAEELRRELTKIIEEDIEAFDAVMRAYGMPRLTKDEPTTRAQAIQAALKKATSVPMRCCRACREVITIGGVVAEKGNRNVVSDAGVAAQAAYAALRSSAIPGVGTRVLVRVDVRSIRSGPPPVGPSSAVGYLAHVSLAMNGSRPAAR
jgi:formiminotetrahydrofolate cyclodeaminase